MMEKTDMMKNVTRQHCDVNLMRDIKIYDGKSIELLDWLLQIEKVAALTNSQEYKLATAKSTSIIQVSPPKLTQIEKNMKVYCTMSNMKYQKYNSHTNKGENNKSNFTSKNTINMTSKNYTYLGTCWKCNEFGP